MSRPRFQFRLWQLLAATAAFGVASLFLAIAKRFQREFLLSGAGVMIAFGLGVCLFLASSDRAGDIAILLFLGLLMLVVVLFCITFFGGF
jgi:hypothetical protein